MPFQLLDLILVGIMLISGSAGPDARLHPRGPVAGRLGRRRRLPAWFSALNPQLVAARRAISSTQEIVAKIAVGGGVFLIVLIIMSLISVKISDWVLDCAAGAFDRTLGFAYGLARGLVARGDRLFVLRAGSCRATSRKSGAQCPVPADRPVGPQHSSISIAAGRYRRSASRIMTYDQVRPSPGAPAQPAPAEPGDEDEAEATRRTQRKAWTS